MRCSKSCYLCDLELGDLFENAVIEQIYCQSTTPTQEASGYVDFLSSLFKNFSSVDEKSALFHIFSIYDKLRLTYGKKRCYV